MKAFFSCILKVVYFGCRNLVCSRARARLLHQSNLCLGNLLCSGNRLYSKHYQLDSWHNSMAHQSYYIIYLKEFNQFLFNRVYLVHVGKTASLDHLKIGWTPFGTFDVPNDRYRWRCSSGHLSWFCSLRLLFGERCCSGHLGLRLLPFGRCNVIVLLRVGSGLNLVLDFERTHALSIDLGRKCWIVYLVLVSFYFFANFVFFLSAD